ncbi:MAG: HEPN domain-containing protein [Clostridiaceae bacterium]
MLLLLNNKCKVIDEDFGLIENDCIELLPYGVQARYPYQLDITEDDMLNAIKNAEKIEEFIKGKIEN